MTVTTKLPERYPGATNAARRTHRHILWLMREGPTANEIASMLGFTPQWIRTVVARCNRAGEPVIRDHRITLPGAPYLLTVEQQKERDQA